MPPPFPVGADVLAQWTPAHENDFRWLKVQVIETLPAVSGSETLYRVQTNMGITMVLPESALTDLPASNAKTTLPVEADFGEP